MKKLFIISSITFLSILSWQYNANAQKIIQFDFKTKTFIDDGNKTLQSLKLGELYQIQICNINTNLYKISIGKRDTIINTALTFPTFGTFGTDVLQTLVGSLATGGLIGTTPIARAMNITTDANKSLLKTMLKGENFAKDFSQLAIDQKLSKPPTEHDIIKAAMYAYETTLRDDYKKLSALKVKTDNLINQYNIYQIQVQVENSANSATTGFFNTSALTMDHLYSELNSIRSDLNNLNDDVNNANVKYLEQTKTYADGIQKDTALKNSDNKLKSTYTQFSTTVSKAIDVVSPDNSLKFITALMVVINNIDRNYTSLPIQFSKDQNILTISITPRTDGANLQPYSTNIVFPIKSDNFWAVSSGIYWSTLYNKSYSVQKSIGVTTDTSYKILSEKPAAFEFGLNAMMRHGWKVNSKSDDLYLQYGFGPGVTVSDKVRARAMFGFGIAKGKKSKIVIDAGIVTGYTDQLSVLYKENASYSIAPGVVTVSSLHAGGYISFGYLFN